VYKVEDYIRKEYRDAGLEVYEHEFTTVSPVTKYREMYIVSDSATEKVNDVVLYPFMPNHMQPVATPGDGVTGELVILDEHTLKTRSSFDGCIGLVNSKTGAYDADYGFHWVQYAKSGIKALIITHSDGLDEAPWVTIADRFNGMVSSIPVNFVRLAADKEILNYVGKKIKLRVKSEYVPARNVTLLGVLRASNPSKKAIIISASYDAFSILPDRGYGGLHAVNLATQLQLLQGLQQYRETLKRDIIFAGFSGSMMAEDGVNNLLRVLRPNANRSSDNRLLAALNIEMKTEEQGQRMKPLVERKTNNGDSLQMVRAISALFDNPAFIDDIAVTDSLIESLDSKTKDFFDEQYSYVINTIAFNLNEPRLQAKIPLEREGLNIESDIFKHYMKAKRRYDQAVSAAGYSIHNLLKNKKEFVENFQVRQKCIDRFRELKDYHTALIRQIGQEIELVELFESYNDFAVFEPRPFPAFNEAEAKEIITFAASGREKEPALPTIVNLLFEGQHSLGLNDSIQVIPVDPQEHKRTVGSALATDIYAANSISMWNKFGYATYGLINLNRKEASRHISDPALLPFIRNIESLKQTLSVFGQAMLMAAHGSGKVEPVSYSEFFRKSFGGRVLVSGVGQSIVPNYPLKNAIIANRGMEQRGMYSLPGYFQHTILLTNPYGRYYLPDCAADFWDFWRVNSKKGHNPLAAAVGDDGVITYIKDEGQDGQRLFKSVNISSSNEPAIENATIVMFRGAPITITDLTNPQNMKDYSGLKMIDKEGLSELRKQIGFEAIGLRSIFLEPDNSVYAQLLSGAPGNELVQMPRAFMLGINSLDDPDLKKEIDGKGYLVADQSFINNVPEEAALSMTYVNGKRLELQNRYAMADEQTNEYHQKCIAHIDSMRAKESLHFSKHEGRNAVTYASLNHPVLRDSIAEAIFSILWYLALLVPFVFFMEKLLFCFPDVRKQLVAQTVIFLVAFFLLRTLHPAFQMVRSSLMILLGFIIIIISSIITILFSGKFKENLEELRKKQGKVTAAEVNKMGVVASAFMLGLNNMHRRKLRTGLTCATLTLLTFGMISFTSIQNNVVEEDIALGTAPYQGMLIRRDRFEPVSTAEVFAFKNKYSDFYDVAERYMVVSRAENNKGQERPVFKTVYQNGDMLRQTECNGVLQFSHVEPLQNHIGMLTERRWFSANDDQKGNGVYPAIIPDAIAGALGLSVDAVNSGENVDITINGRRFEVIGIFDSESFQTLKDLNGFDMLPFDIINLTEIIKINDLTVLAEDTDPRIPAENVILLPNGAPNMATPNSERRVISVAVHMPEAGYREARETIETYMEQTAQPVFYGLDGIAYKGKRVRTTTLGGLIDLLIPLIIAGLTVLNTMRGSVYERRDEIFVYNAVGIAPKYVFFMFITEAFVYAIVASVLGYLISQGTGRILTELNMTGGLNMTFTSVATIYASLTIAGAVFISTYFPAKSAMEIAAPAEDAGWSLPEPEGDELAMDLPFNFASRGRIAILAFFNRFIMDHGEGSAGSFFAGTPELEVVGGQDDSGAGVYIPQISAMTWLKPFDLAVSQRMTISLPTDPETGEYKAVINLHRFSGTKDSWMRLNKSFIVLIRKQFLHWRAVTVMEQKELFEEAKALIVSRYSNKKDIATEQYETKDAETETTNA